MSQPRNRLPVDVPPSAAPAASAAGLSPAGFMMYPLPSVSAAQAELYQWALAQAQAVAKPSLLERDVLGYWN